MKTTLDNDDRLLREAKAAAARQLTRLIEQGIELRLHPPRRRSRPERNANSPFFAGIEVACASTSTRAAIALF